MKALYKSINIILLIGIVFLTGCCRSVTDYSTSYDVTEVEHIIPLPPVYIKDSGSVSLSPQEVKGDSGATFQKESRDRGIRTTITRKADGSIICQATIDSLLRVNDSLSVMLPDTVWKVQKTITKFKASNFDIALRWFCGFLLLVIVIGIYIFAKRK